MLRVPLKSTTINFLSLDFGAVCSSFSSHLISSRKLISWCVFPWSIPGFKEEVGKLISTSTLLAPTQTLLFLFLGALASKPSDFLFPSPILLYLRLNLILPFPLIPVQSSLRFYAFTLALPMTPTANGQLLFPVSGPRSLSLISVKACRSRYLVYPMNG